MSESGKEGSGALESVMLKYRLVVYLSMRLSVCLSPPPPQLHDATDSSEEQVRIYRALGASKTEALTRKCLAFAVSVSSCIHSIVLDTSLYTVVSIKHKAYPQYTGKIVQWHKDILTCRAPIRILVGDDSCRRRCGLMTCGVCCSLPGRPVPVPGSWSGSLCRRSGRG